MLTVQQVSLKGTLQEVFLEVALCFATPCPHVACLVLQSTGITFLNSVSTVLNGFPGDSDDPWVGEIPWRREWQPTPVFLPGKSHGQRSLEGYSPWGRKELDTTERPHFLSFCFKYSEWFLFSWKTLRNTHLYFFWLLEPSQKSGQRKRGCQHARDSLQTETKRLSRSMGLADKLWFNRFPPLSQEKCSINHRCRQEL